MQTGGHECPLAGGRTGVGLDNQRRDDARCQRFQTVTEQPGRKHGTDSTRHTGNLSSYSRPVERRRGDGLGRPRLGYRKKKREFFENCCNKPIRFSRARRVLLERENPLFSVFRESAVIRYKVDRWPKVGGNGELGLKNGTLLVGRHPDHLWCDRLERNGCKKQPGSSRTRMERHVGTLEVLHKITDTVGDL